MRSKIWIGIVMCFIISTLLVTISCAPKATPRPAAAVTQPTDMNAEEEAARRAAEEARIAEENLAAQQTAAAQAARERFMNEDISFDFDSSLLTFEAQAILRAKAQWLRENNATVTVEGHCDERGTNEYNLALGDRRARSAKTFLVDLGISAGRIKTVSYGEERPLDPGNSESAWTKNRRAHFVIQ